jgi:maltose-binding protein MalE
MKRKVLALVACAVFMSFSLAYAEELVVNSMHSDPLPQETFAEIVKKFQEANPDIQVKLNTTAHEEFKKSVRLWLASDTPPDVITWFAGNRAMYFVNKGLIMDISDVWQDAGLFEKFPKAFQSISLKDGKAYFLPDTYYWWAIYYRKSIFAQYNLTEPKTWDELMKVCATLKENGIAPFAIGTKHPWTAAACIKHIFHFPKVISSSHLKVLVLVILINYVILSLTVCLTHVWSKILMLRWLVNQLLKIQWSWYLVKYLLQLMFPMNKLSEKLLKL